MLPTMGNPAGLKLGRFSLSLHQQISCVMYHSILSVWFIFKVVAQLNVLVFAFKQTLSCSIIPYGSKEVSLWMILKYIMPTFE